EHAAHALRNARGIELDVPLDVPSQLKIQSPQIVRLFVEQRRLSAREGRIEPEPALGGPLGFHPDVDDQEMILEDIAGEIEAEHRADRAPGSVGRDQVVGIDEVTALRRVDADLDAFVALADPAYPRLPAQ